jgi:hypothetical protein
MDVQSIGRMLLVVGIGIAILGGCLLLLGNLPVFRQSGSLTGDIRFEIGNLTCFVPFVSMLLISVVLTVLVNIIIRLFNRP